jgi:non-heme chloroperoxidase
VYTVRLMPLNWNRLVRGACIGLFIYVAIVGLLIAFGTSRPPPVAPLITKPFADIDTGALPQSVRYRARDGALLSYRQYRASEGQVAVLLHGSAGSGVDMHPLALALQRAGITALVPDVRGHGANHPHGDVAYVGQLDDDLSDLIAYKKPEFSRSAWTILGFSSGAAFGLRFAAESPAGQVVDRYVLVSPYLRYNAPSVRQPEPGAAAPHSWASASVGRIIGLTILNQLGVHILNGLPVLSFPVPAHIDAATRTYSWRMYRNFGADDDYLADIHRAARPMRVFVGGSDELLDAQKLKTEFDSQRSDVPVSIIPGLGHSDMVTRPEAILALVAAFNQDTYAGHGMKGNDP